MYAFFFVAGVTYRYQPNEKFGDFLLKNIKRLYVPYLFYAFLWDAFELAMGVLQGVPADLSGQAMTMNVLSVLMGGDVFPSTASVGPAWFLCALLSVRVIYNGVAKCVKNDRVLMGVFCGAMFILAYLLRGKTFLPFRMIQSLSGFAFFFVGHLCAGVGPAILRRTESTGGKVVCALLAAVTGLITWLAARCADTDLILAGNTLPGSMLVTLAAGFAGCLMLLLIAVLVEKVGLADNALAFFGRNSMTIMGTHSELRMMLYLLLERILGMPKRVTVLPVFVLSIVLIIPICAAIRWLRSVPEKKHGIAGR